MSRFRTPYPDYDVLDKWNSPSWNDQTRAVVEQRLDAVPERRFLTEGQWSLLEAICARLLPQPERDEPVPIVPWIDQMLDEDRGPGFRYADMPPMRDAWRKGLEAIAAEALHRHGKSFEQLGPDQQDGLLADIQNDQVESGNWGGLPARRFFNHQLLKQVVAVYYAQPAAWNEIGFGGPASPRGYARLGFDQRDPWEAREQDGGSGDA